MDGIRYDQEWVIGDTWTKTITVELNGVKRSLVNGDHVYLTMEDPDGVEVINKDITSFTDGNAVVELVSSDSKDLDEGVYKYDIVVVYADGDRYTLIRKSNWKWRKGVTNV